MGDNTPNYGHEHNALKNSGAKRAIIPEAQAKQALRQLLFPRFDWKEEVVGRSHLGQAVKIDFWCYPKDGVVAQGWPAEWFGIEVKGYALQDQRKKAACRLLYQAITYRFSTFPGPTGDTRPHFVLVHPSFATLIDSPRATEVIDDTLQNGYWLALSKTAGMFRVGELHTPIPDSDTFEVYFHGINRQYSSHWGWARADYLGAEDNHASR